MSRIIHHERVHHAVGAGLFHSAAVSVADENGTFRYVYDCGGNKPVFAAVRDYVRAHQCADGNAYEIDAVFISHFHRDHLNGFAKLTKRGALRTKRLYLPHLTPVQQLLQLVGSSQTPSGLALAYFRGGGGALRDVLDIQEVIEVDPPGPDSFVPPSDTPPNDGFEPSGLPGDGIRVAVELGVGGSSGGGLQSASQRIYLLDEHGSPFWEFVPYVDGQDPAQEARLQAAIAVLLGRPDGDAIKRWVSEQDEPTVDALATYLLSQAGWRSLRKIYQEQFGDDVNATSMSLYSGPIGTVKSAYWEGDPAGRIREARWVSWLGTGDGYLHDQPHVERFARHFGGRLNALDAFLLPHHGSDGNLSDAIGGRIQANRAIVSHGTSYRHPHDGAIGAAVRAGMDVLSVNLDPRSRLRERLTIEIA